MISGLSTLFYGPINLPFIPKSIYIVIPAMLISGLSSAHTLVPAVPEIIEAGKEELGYPEDVLNDFSSGLFNMNFAVGEIFGPLIGNKLYVDFGMEKTSNFIGGFVLTFVFIYYLMCDKSMPWNRVFKPIHKRQ